MLKKYIYPRNRNDNKKILVYYMFKVTCSIFTEEKKMNFLVTLAC